MSDERRGKLCRSLARPFTDKPYGNFPEGNEALAGFEEWTRDARDRDRAFALGLAMCAEQHGLELDEPSSKAPSWVREAMSRAVTRTRKGVSGLEGFQGDVDLINGNPGPKGVMLGQVVALFTVTREGGAEDWVAKEEAMPWTGAHVVLTSRGHLREGKVWVSAEATGVRTQHEAWLHLALQGDCQLERGGVRASRSEVRRGKAQVDGFVYHGRPHEAGTIRVKACISINGSCPKPIASQRLGLSKFFDRLGKGVREAGIFTALWQAMPYAWSCSASGPIDRGLEGMGQVRGMGKEAGMESLAGGKGVLLGMLSLLEEAEGGAGVFRLELRCTERGPLIPVAEEPEESLRELSGGHLEPLWSEVDPAYPVPLFADEEEWVRPRVLSLFSRA